MKEPLKVGDRVRVWGGIPDGSKILNGAAGIVIGTGRIEPDGDIKVQFGQEHGGSWNVFSQQCRRLVKKQWREWKIFYQPCKHDIAVINTHVCKEWFVEGPPTGDKPILVREVRK